jgi:O-methyltransferase involved in polyketide biosynthesis
MKLNINVNDISETAFLTLQCHALDAQSQRPLLSDKRSIETLDILKKHFSESDSILHKKLFENKVKNKLIVYTVLRAKRYDSYILDFLNKYPNSTVVNIGCGLDTRFERIDNGSIHYYDLDLPDIMNIKRQIFPEKERYHQISKSVFEFDWIDKIESEHVILVAEGVFMYCNGQDVKSLFLTLQERLPNSEMVCEVFNSKWLKGWRKKTMEFKLKKELRLGEGTTFQFGISDSDEIGRWNQGLKLIDDWSYLDSGELNSRVLRLFRKNDSFRKIQWTVHYKLNKI